MNTTLDVAAALSAIIWPIVVLIILLVYRKPLGSFLSGLSGRLTKLSAFDISLELAVLPSVPLINPQMERSAEMAGGDVTSTDVMELLSRMDREAASDYLIVDIKNGQFWFASRVFIFSVFLERMRGLKCIVFVQTWEQHYRSLLGIAPASSVRSALGQAYPWMEKVLAKVLNSPKQICLDPTLPLSDASQLVRAFIDDRDMRLDCKPEEFIKPTNNCNISAERRPTDSVIPGEWVRRGSMNTWEHTQWLDLDIVNTVLRKSFFEWDSSHYKELPGVSKELWSKELLQRKAPFIALVNSRDEFKRLVDRQKLAVLVGELLIEER